MAHDVPADVRDVLTQLHEAAVEAARGVAGTSTDGRDDGDESRETDDGDHPPETDGVDDPLETDEDGDAPEAFTAPVETAQTVATNKLPPGPLRSQFTHGYDRALAVVDGEPAVAAEYVRAVDRRLVAATDRESVVGGDDANDTATDASGTAGDTDSADGTNDTAAGANDATEEEGDDPDEDL